MGSIVTNLLSGGIEGAGKGIANVISAIKGKNPEDAAKLAQMQADVQELQIKYAAEFALAKVDENVKLNDIAGQNIRAEQGSRFTAWARPSVVYAWIAVILYNYIVTGIIHRQPISMPDMFWQVSGIVITGYVFSRSADKAADTLLGGAGGSAQLPFGIKLDSKG